MCGRPLPKFTKIKLPPATPEQREVIKNTKIEYGLDITIEPSDETIEEVAQAIYNRLDEEKPE